MNPKIFGALLIGVAMVLLAYFFAPASNSQKSTAESDGPIVGAAPKREYIEVADSNNDGIPDWREEMLVVDPIRIDTEDLEATTTTEERTLTGDIAIQLVEQAIQSQIHGTADLGHDLTLARAQQQIANAALDEEYTEDDIIVNQNNDPETLRVYGNQVIGIIFSTVLPPGTPGEAEIFVDAVTNKDAAQLEELAVHEVAYQQMTELLLQVPVPSIAVNDHLVLLNIINSIRIDIRAMRDTFKDPMVILARLETYIKRGVAINPAIERLFDTLYYAGARWKESDIVSRHIIFEE